MDPNLFNGVERFESEEEFRNFVLPLVESYFGEIVAAIPVLKHPVEDTEVFEHFTSCVVETLFNTLILLAAAQGKLPVVYQNLSCKVAFDSWEGCENYKEAFNKANGDINFNVFSGNDQKGD